MNETAAMVALWLGLVLSTAALLTGGYRVYRWFDRLRQLMDGELKHNGGSSLKDHAKIAATESTATNALLLQLLARVGEVEERIAEKEKE
jgi:DNA-binding transcriptional MerR regulator